MLQTITGDLWAYEEDLRLPLGLRLPSRTVIVRLPGDKLVIHSPLSITDAFAKELDARGEVAHIVSPSNVHYLFLQKAAERWPKAKLHGAPGLEKKVKGLPFDALPEEGDPKAFGGELVVRKIGGVPYISEHLFLHPKSGTLLATDLVFNVHACNFGMSLFLRVMGAYKKLAQSRIWRVFTRDRKVASRAINDVLRWDFDRLVMAHGTVVESNARAQLTHAVRWLAS